MTGFTREKTKLDAVAERFENEDILLVYGTGKNAGYFCGRMKSSACQLVFFDRRAEAEELYFAGRKVRPPRDMLNYPDAPVLVTPAVRQKEIAGQLTGMGIGKSRIHLFPEVPESPVEISMLTLVNEPEDPDRVGKPIVFSRDIFSRARQNIKYGDPTDYPVLSSDGRTLFWLHAADRNALWGYNGHLGITTPDFYHGEKLADEADRLDLTLLSSYEGYVFDGLEEYTFALTELTLSLWPERPVWHRDPRAAMFWGEEQVHIIPDSGDAALPQSRNLMRILTGRTYLIKQGKRAEQRHCFDSIQLMCSLCWARKIRRLGEKNPDKTIFVIDVAALSAGMGDLIKIVQAYAGAAGERGWTPVAWLHNTQYSDDPEKDLWSEWFEPLSEVSLEDALHSTRVIMSGENGGAIASGGQDPAWNPYLEYYLTAQPLRLSEELNRRFERSAGAKPDGNSLGVIVRGSDRLVYVEPDKRPELDKLIGQVTAARREGHFNKVFLATEEEETLAAFRAALGEDLLYVDQKRIREYQEGDPQIWERLQPPLGERMAWGKKYLYIIWCLSRCGALINNVYCGSFEIARRLREGRGEQFRSLP